MGRHAKQKAQQGEVAEAAAVLSQLGASSEPANFELYKHIVGGVLALPRSEHSKQGELDCKDFLWQLVQPVLGAAAGSQLPVKVGLCQRCPCGAVPELPLWGYARVVLVKLCWRFSCGAVPELSLWVCARGALVGLCQRCPRGAVPEAPLWGCARVVRVGDSPLCNDTWT